MVRPTLVCLLLCALAWGQEVKPTPKAPMKPAAKPVLSTTAPIAKGPAARNASLAMPVITIPGICDKKPATPGAACETVITRAEFEKLADGVQPNMTPTERKQFADGYTKIFVLAHKAHEKGLDKGPAYEFALLQLLAEQMISTVKKEAAQISDKELEDYYRTHAAVYEEAAISRIYIPKTKPITGEEKLSEADKEKYRQEAAAAMKKTAEDLQIRAAAGEDFTKLQAEAFQAAGTKARGINPSLGKLRRSGRPPNHAFILDLKSGEVSQLISDPAAGYFIYKVDAKETLPLNKVREEILSALENQKMQDAMQQIQQIQQSVTPVFDENYFAGSPEVAQQGMSLP